MKEGQDIVNFIYSGIEKPMIIPTDDYISKTVT